MGRGKGSLLQGPPLWIPRLAWTEMTCWERAVLGQTPTGGREQALVTSGSWVSERRVDGERLGDEGVRDSKKGGKQGKREKKRGTERTKGREWGQK